ncbi:MAG: hypothetical protein JWQ35_202 [Bacteriovoracaceae bacterium]|nr:hypothetical protein [Bacteriovoracaceae bacterium]
MGGTVLPLLGIGSRLTEDIDFIGFDAKERSQNLELMEIAESLEIPVEAINQAAGFFLKKIDSWRQRLVLLHEGRSAKIFRPHLNLYLLLKIPRLSESDLDDCLHFIRYAKSIKELVDKKLILKAIRQKRKSSDSIQLLNRLELLENELINVSKPEAN